VFRPLIGGRSQRSSVVGGTAAPTEGTHDRGSGVVAAFSPMQDVAFPARLGLE
jgi:hypothetical protein